MTSIRYKYHTAGAKTGARYVWQLLTAGSFHFQPVDRGVISEKKIEREGNIHRDRGTAEAELAKDR